MIDGTVFWNERGKKMHPRQPEERAEIEDLLRIIRDLVREAPRLLLASFALLVIGFLGGVIIGGGFFWFLFFVGLVLLVVWFLQRYRVLGKEEVVEKWGILIGGGQGRADNIFGDTERLITETKAPDIKMEQREVGPSFLRGVLGGRRDFLLISNNTNSHLKPYRMYINARDYGKNLQISWYVVHQPGFWRKALGLLLLVPGFNLFILPFYLAVRLTRAREAGLLGLDLFDQQDLTAYVTNAHHCLREAVENLMTGMGQDTSEIDWKSRGFLGIS